MMAISRVARSSGAALFDPATLSLSLWCPGSYGGSPWAGAASAGASSGRNLAEATNPFSVGSNVNGYTAGSADGTNDMLHSSGGGYAWDELVTASAYSYGGLAKVANAATAAANIYDDKQIFCDVGQYSGLSIIDSAGTLKARAWHWDGGYKMTNPDITIPTADWFSFHVWYDGTTIRLDINLSGSPVTVAAGNLGAGWDTGAPVLRVGRNYASAYLQFELLEPYFSTTDIGGTARTNLQSYYLGKYGEP